MGGNALRQPSCRLNKQELLGLIVKFNNEIGEPFKVVTTGGLGRIFKDDTDVIDVYDPDLIFKGMALIYKRNVR